MARRRMTRLEELQVRSETLDLVVAFLKQNQLETSADKVQSIGRFWIVTVPGRSVGIKK